jgi:RNA polymerase sigma-70 factor, ECF subfamily
MDEQPEARDQTFRKAIEGDRFAFADLVRAHQSMVFSIAWNYLHDNASAEELAQEVFLEMHRNLSNLDSAAHLTFWLRRVTTNRCIDQTRRMRTRPRLGLDDIPEPAISPEMPDTLLGEAIRKLTAALPEKPRMVVILRYQEDLEPTEIARVLDMPLNTVKSHLQRSLAMLREKLERTQVRL